VEPHDRRVVGLADGLEHVESALTLRVIVRRGVAEVWDVRDLLEWLRGARDTGDA